MSKYYNQTHVCLKCDCVMTIRSKNGVCLIKEYCPECGHEMRFAFGNKAKEAENECKNDT